MERGEVIRLIGSTAESLGLSEMSLSRFEEVARIDRRVVLEHFDKWSDACRAAGIKGAPSGIKPRVGFTTEQCIAELQRIARLTGKPTVSIADLGAYGSMSDQPFRRLFGDWQGALAAAGLAMSECYMRELTLGEVASAWVGVVREVGAIPSLHQVCRRLPYGRNTFARKYGRYSNFKAEAVRHLLASEPSLPPELETLLRCELGRLLPHAQSLIRPEPHVRGRALGFRAFAFAPSCEQDVVALFSAVADELGFVILANRAAFPDCEAQRRIPGRRDRYRHCLIEYEFASKDFHRHGHPMQGCDLIVCWNHDWADCPVEVLELSRAIRPLSGWK